MIAIMFTIILHFIPMNREHIQRTCKTTLMFVLLLLITNVLANQNEANIEEIPEIIRTFDDVPTDIPQNVTLEAASSTSVIIRWETPPRESMLAIITGYKIKYKVKGNRKHETVTTDGNRRLFEITNLERGITYMVKIAAFSPNGTGPFTEWMPIDTFQNDLNESQVPDKPHSLRAKPSSNTIFVTWTPPKNQNIMIRGYTIGWGIGFPDVYTKVLNGKERSFVVENLQATSEYVISLRAFNQIGDGQPIYETVKTLTESAGESPLAMMPPVGLKATVLSATSVALYWTDTSLARDQVITDNRRYLVRYTGHVNANNPKYRYFNSTKLNCMIDDLKPNSQYEFAVKVVRGKKESTWSMSVLNTTAEAAPSSAPRDLTVVPSNDDDPTIINLHWQPPKQPNGQITGYVIFYTQDNTLRDRDWAVEGVIGDKMTHVLKELLPDKTYYFKIQARNNKGNGPLSAEVSFKTLLALPRSLENNFSDGKNISTNTLYIIIAVISGITVLLLIVVGTLLCRSRSNASNGYIGGMRKPKGYMAAATSPGKMSIGKGKGRDLKPPDLWIHHDQMELKAIEKGNETMTVTPIQRNSQEINDDAMIEKAKKTTSTYGDSLYDDIGRGETHSHGMRDNCSPTDTSIIMSGNSTTQRKAARAKQITIPEQNGVISLEPSTGLSRPLYPRTQFNMPRAHVTLDANDSNAGITNHHNNHHFYDPVASPHLQMGISNVIATGQMASNSAYSSGTSLQVIPSNGPSPGINSAMGKRQYGSTLKSFSVPNPSNHGNNNTATPSTPHIVRPQLISSPHKKMSPGNNMSLSSVASHKSTSFAVSPSSRGPNSIRRDDLSSSYSTEELNQEMANLEGLMKDLSAITASEFEC